MKEEVYMVAKFDYTANQKQELSFKKNERFKLIDDSNDWWQVTNKCNQSGFVPNNYLRKESPMDKAMELLKGIRKQEVGNSKFELPDSKVIDCIISTAIVKFSYEPQVEDDLRLIQGDTIAVLEKRKDGWWKGWANGETGWLPSNFVEEERQIRLTPRSETNESSSSASVMELTSLSSHSSSSERIVQEDDERRRAEEEARRRAEEGTVQLRHQREEVDARRRAAKAEANRLRREREADEARREVAEKLAADEAKNERFLQLRKAEEENERFGRLPEEEKARKRAAEEDALREAEEEARRRAAEEETDRLRRLRDEEEAQRRAVEEDARRRAAEDVRRIGEERAHRRAEEDCLRQKVRVAIKVGLAKPILHLFEIHRNRVHIPPFRVADAPQTHAPLQEPPE
uniref:SH3 domain-containing protein n=1 Tax=Plectus sambesii TaxID=2011161 RepID=A0A914X7K0_9BILA